MSRATAISDDVILKTQLGDRFLAPVKDLIEQWDREHKDEYDRGFAEISRRRDEEVLTWKRKKNTARRQYLEGLYSRMEGSISVQSAGDNQSSSDSPFTSLGNTPELEERLPNMTTKIDHAERQPELITYSRLSKPLSAGPNSAIRLDTQVSLQIPQVEASVTALWQPPSEDDQFMDDKIPEGVEDPHDTNFEIGTEKGEDDSDSAVDVDERLTKNAAKPGVRGKKSTCRKREPIHNETPKEVLPTDTCPRRQSLTTACMKEASPLNLFQTKATKRSETPSIQNAETSEDNSLVLFLDLSPSPTENDTTSSEHHPSSKTIHPDKARKEKSHSRGSASSAGPSRDNDDSTTGTDKGPRKRRASAGALESEIAGSQEKRPKNLLGIKQSWKNPESTRGKTVRIVKPKKKPYY